MKDSERVGLPVSIDADRSGNSHCVGLHLIALQIYTPCLVVATPVCDRDVGGLSCHAIAIIARQRGDGCGGSGAIVVKSSPRTVSGAKWSARMDLTVSDGR